MPRIFIFFSNSSSILPSERVRVVYYLKTVRANLKYHRKTTFFYLLFLSLAFFFLFLSENLNHCLPYLNQYSRQLLTSSGYAMDQSALNSLIEKPFSVVADHYQTIKGTLLIVLSLLLLVFFLFCRQNKKGGLSGCRSGCSIFSWITLNLLAALLPLLLVASCFLILIIAFQPFWNHLVLELQAKLLELFTGRQILLDPLDTNTLQQFVVRFPKTNSALIQSLSLSNNTWNNILFFSFIWTLWDLIRLICLSKLISMGIDHFRRKPV